MNTKVCNVVEQYVLCSGSVGKVPWVPGNPSILGQWILEPINFRKKQPKCAQISLENEQEIGAWNLE